MPGQRAFQIATQLALLSQSDLISAIVATDDQLSAESRGVARIGLANYFAGAFLLPYREFHQAAEELRYDIDLLARRFEMGFETVCHRLSTLQRPQQRGVPFIFVRTDKAGNISKRQSATAFHFSRVGGSCPLWVVHDAFAQPGRIVVQVAQMPDGRSYFWVAKTTVPEGRVIWASTRASPSGWAATWPTPTNWSTPPGSSSTIRPPRSRSGPAARSATGRRAPSARSPISAGASWSMRMRAAACPIRPPTKRFESSKKSG